MNESTQHLTSKKKILFFVLTLFLPVVFLICLEAGLRVFHYGHDLSLFGRQEIHGKIYYVMNPDVKFRYFGTSPFAPSTSIHYFLVPKPEGVYRIFCLGGSTTVGYPYYFNASFPSLLEERLTALFPQKKVEVINLGMTATNSFTALDIAKELSHVQPDLIIDYDGHNEFYGVLGVASHQTIGSVRFITQAYLQLIHLRSFQLLRNTVRAITNLWSKPGDSMTRATMMEVLARDKYIPRGSPEYIAAYSIFRDNLLDLKQYCRSMHIPLLLGTQVSNLRDQPPFVSNNSALLSQQQKEQFQFLYKSGRMFQAKNMLDSAIAAFQSAIGIDSLYADAHYRLGRCYDAANEKGKALFEYVRARDYDELRFRTDGKFNSLIRSMADSAHCFVADHEIIFKSSSPDSLIGTNLITEHLHPYARGSFLLAKNYAQIMRSNGLMATQQEWNSADTLNENALWQNRCVTDLDELMAVHSLNVITSGWPFKSQSAHSEMVSRTDTLGLIARQLAVGNLGWMEAHIQAISLYRQRREWNNVEREYRTILHLYPHIVDLYMELASVYFQQKRFDDMKTLLLTSLQVYPTLPAYFAIGNILLDQGDSKGALNYFEKMDEIVQSSDEKVQYGFALCYAYAKAGEFVKAKTRLSLLLSEQPNFGPALDLLKKVNKQLAAK